MTEKQFQIAAFHAKSLSNIKDGDMLKLYGLYKQSLIGPCNIPKPSFWDFTAKSKWESWTSVSHLPSDDAKRQYIALVKQLDKSWDENIDTDKNTLSKKPTGFGVAVSTMVCEDEDEILDDDKTILDWCKDGKIDKLKLMIDKDKTLLNYVDSGQMTLLHWATDRGYVDIVQYLINEHTFNLNSVNSEGQTALHFAVACEYEGIVRLLLAAGVDITIKDGDGCTAIDLCENKEIKLLLSI